MVKTVEISGAEVKVEKLGGQNVAVKNLGSAPIYASIQPNITAGADNVVEIPAGAGEVVLDANGTLYLLGNGKVQCTGTNYASPNFKLPSSSSGEGGKTVAGSTAYMLDNAVDYPIVDLRLYGKSTQTQYSGKNLLNNIGTSVEVEGVSFTINNDGTIKVTGTATRQVYVIINSAQPLIVGEKYILSGCPEGGWHDKYRLNVRFGEAGAYEYFFDTGNGLEFTALESTVFVYFEVFANVPVDFIVYPMIRLASITDNTYEPYVGGIPSPNPEYPQDIVSIGDSGAVKVSTNNGDDLSFTATITSALPLCGIPVDTDGNYTDSAGQQWICDELIYNADGTGKVVKRTAKIDSYNGETVAEPYLSTMGSLTTGATVICALNTPQEIDLTAEEMAQLEAFQTFDGVTNISNDGGADMQIKYCTNVALSEYEKPVIDGLKKQINELKTAVLSLGGNV